MDLSAQFLCGAPHALLTASNDAVVTLWDAQGPPRASTRDQDSSDTKICIEQAYSARMSQAIVPSPQARTKRSFSVLSASTGISVVRRFDALHSKVVKPSRFATRMFLRQRVTIVRSLPTRACSRAVVWSRSARRAPRRKSRRVSSRNSNELMTASFDNAIRIWDVRKMKAKTDQLGPCVVIRCSGTDSAAATFTRLLRGAVHRCRGEFRRSLHIRRRLRCARVERHLEYRGGHIRGCVRRTRIASRRVARG